MHGGPDAQGVPLHDFSTNANACGPCPVALQAVRHADASRYPDPRYAALRARLADFHGVAPGRVLIAASASEFILRITAWVAQRHRDGMGAVWLPARSYGDYEAAAQAWGLQTLRAPASPADAALHWFCDPSSPLGQPQPDLGALVDALPAQAVAVLDRAYEPLRLQGRLALGDRQLARVWQLWSPNKALGLTGVRAAYAIAPEQGAAAVEALMRLAPSWPTGAHGVAMLTAWTEPAVRQWLVNSLDTLRAWKAQQRVLCAELGWPVLASDANYFCALPVTPDLPSALKRLRAAGIKLRDASSFGMPGYVRMGVRGPGSQQALRAAWG